MNGYCKINNLTENVRLIIINNSKCQSNNDNKLYSITSRCKTICTKLLSCLFVDTWVGKVYNECR